MAEFEAKAFGSGKPFAIGHQARAHAGECLFFVTAPATFHREAAVADDEFPPLRQIDSRRFHSGFDNISIFGSLTQTAALHGSHPLEMFRALFKSSTAAQDVIFGHPN